MTQKRKLKKITVGFEVEFFILNQKGLISNSADLLISKLKEKGDNKDNNIVKEVGKNMIEVKSYPHENNMVSLQTLIKNIKTLIYTADENNLLICPLGSYPGEFVSKIRNDDKFEVQRQIFGSYRFKNSARACGFHLHFELPWGVFDRKKLTLKNLIKSKNKDSLINVYNFLIAIDPVIATFMQSSPFIRGKYLAKDSRALLYRGSPELKCKEALYANYPKFGALPSYKHTGMDIIRMNKMRYREWLKILKNVGLPKKDYPHYQSRLTTNWTPVKINPHGTLEQRGMDMNHLSIMFSVSILLKIIINAIQNNHFQVETSDLAIQKPFQLKKKTIYIPPDIYVKNDLQRASVYQGLESEKLLYYMQRALNLAKSLIPRANSSSLNILEEMLDKKETVSDQIINQVQELGHKDLNKKITSSIATEIALKHSKKLFEEIVLIEEYAKVLDNS